MFSRARSLGPGQGKRKVVMKARSLLAGLAVAVFTLAGAVSANAAPSSTGELTLVGKGAIYKEAQRPVDLTLDVAVTPEQGALTLKPLANVTVKFPVGLDLVAVHRDQLGTGDLRGRHVVVSIQPRSSSSPPCTS